MIDIDSTLDKELLGVLVDLSGTSQAAFARQAGVDPKTFNCLLNPKHSKVPKMSTFCAVATALPLKSTGAWELTDDEFRLLALLKGSTPNKAVRSRVERLRKEKR